MGHKKHELRVVPRLIIHGGAGNITPANLPPDQYNTYREALLTIVSRTYTYMTTPIPSPAGSIPTAKLPTAVDTAVHAVIQLEDNALFNAGHGAVFTRDGINELEASVMVSRGRSKRGVGVTGLRRVRNPILLARAMLEHGDEDLSVVRETADASTSSMSSQPGESSGGGLDVPSAQGHTLLHGPTAEVLAKAYGVELVDPSYFYTQRRWDEHIRYLKHEERSGGVLSASWSAEEYLPQGTVGAVALDSNAVICVATSTGGLTNKLTGRIGDTPVPGAGFWAEEWVEDGDPTAATTGVMKSSMPKGWDSWLRLLARPGPVVQLSSSLRGLLADCLPTPFVYTPVATTGGGDGLPASTTRSFAGSGTGNGDSFMRTNAVRTVAAMARFRPVASAVALSAVAGPGGELQRSAGDRWGRRGEGEGGIIGIECAVVRDRDGRIVDSRGEILHDHNCGGMFRAWIDDSGKALYKVFRDVPGAAAYAGEDLAEGIRSWCGENGDLQPELISSICPSPHGIDDSYRRVR